MKKEKNTKEKIKAKKGKKTNNDKILVMIASYCDPELLNTINSAIIQADDKERVHFVVCFQNDNLDDLNKLKKVKNCNIIHLKESEARGSCYARYLCQKEIKDEKYIYMIDSHMRFVKHWDTKMIEQLESIGDKKAILSTYPPFCTEDMMSLPLDDPIYDKPANGSYMYAIRFKSPTNHLMDFTSYLIPKDDKLALKRNPFMSANNFFSYSESQKEVLFDENMFFYGDELPMAIRFFTYGWNIYNPAENYIYHKYERKEHKMPVVTDAMLNERKRFESLINLTNIVDLKEFGLGKVRTLKEYEEFSGIDFKNRIIHMSSETGEFDNPKMKNKISYFQSIRRREEELLRTKEPVCVIVIDKYNDYKECITSCIKNAKSPSRLSFLVATTMDETENINFPYRKMIKKIIHIAENDLYGNYFSKLCESLDDCYVAVVESSFRFVKDWEFYYLDNVKKYDMNGVFTSWVFNANNPEENFVPYKNLIKEYNGFNGYLPTLKFNEEIDMFKRKNPLQTGFISDGFMFCSSKVFKKVLPDPNLSYFDHTLTYSVRLWTNGINIYYPKLSYVVRLKNEFDLNESFNRYDVTSIILGLDNNLSKTLEKGYYYDNGDVRPVWTWYEFIGEPDYDKQKFSIVKKK